jgi:hypothetical protein
VKWPLTFQACLRRTPSGLPQPFALLMASLVS